jgi:hypothetical protein
MAVQYYDTCRRAVKHPLYRIRRERRFRCEGRQKRLRKPIAAPKAFREVLAAALGDDQQRL